MTCILRVSGKTLDVEALASSFPLRPYRLDRVGERRAPRSRIIKGVHESACAHYDVSGQDPAPLALQVADAVRFLSEHRETLAAIRQFTGVDACCLDFGVEWRDTLTHTDLLPPEFLSLVGALGFGIELTHYPARHDEP